MVCLNYDFKRTIVENDETYYIVYAQLFSTDDPDELQLDATDIVNFPQIWPADKVRFQAGSFIYVVSTGTIYIADETFTFVAQS